MKTAIFYFSGTGNTELVVKNWLAALEKEGADAKAFRIEDLKDPLSDDYDKIGIAYPIHAFNAPKIILDFAEKLPVFASQMPFYLLMVSGEPLRLNDGSDQKLRKILKRKHAYVESTWHYIMPYNMIFRHTEERAWKMKQTMEQLVPMDVKQYIGEGRNSHLHSLKGTAPLTALFRIEQWFSPVNGKHFHVTDQCSQCMLCVKSCPVGNITFQNGKIQFLNRCILCTRCSFRCPEDAIRIGLLNGWRVNGPYQFRKPSEPEQDKHPNYCRRSYKKYFQNAEERIRKEQ